MADSPRNRRRTGPPSGSRPKVAGIRKPTRPQGASSSENTNAEVSGSHEESTEVRDSQAGLSSTRNAATGDRVEDVEGTETEQGSGTEPESDSAASDDSPSSDDSTAGPAASTGPADDDSAETSAADDAGTSSGTDGTPDSSEDADSSEGADSVEGAASARESGADDEPDAGADTEAEPTGRSAVWRWLLPAMAVCTVVFAALAVWFQYEVNSLRNEGSASNDALVENAATSEVNGKISDAVEKLFSYDFSDTAKTEKAAKDLLIGNATKEYDQLFSTVKEQAPKQNLVVTTTVKSSGVTNLQGDRAEVLLFVDQKAVRTDSGKNNVGPAQISVGAEKHGDQWKINKIVQR